MIRRLLLRLRCAVRGHRFRIAGWYGRPFTQQRIVWKCACGEVSVSDRRGFFPDALRPPWDRP